MILRNVAVQHPETRNTHVTPSNDRRHALLPLYGRGPQNAQIDHILVRTTDLYTRQAISPSHSMM